MPTLYVIEEYARLEKEYQSFIVTKDDEVIFKAPVNMINAIVIGGNVGLTTPAINSLLHTKIPVYFINSLGKTIGSLQPFEVLDPDLWIKQLDFYKNSQAKLKLAKEIVLGKIRNQRVFALRIARRHLAVDRTFITQLYHNEELIKSCTDIKSILGYEGSAAKAYFEIYKGAFNPIWNFNNRNRKPSKDPINGLLNLGYSLLAQVVTTAILISGLNPCFGIFHNPGQKRPALSLDLMEEFRAPLVDSLVMSLVNRNVFAPDDFILRNGSFQLKVKPLKIFLAKFGDLIDRQIKLEKIKKKLTYRKIMELQAQKLKKLIEGQTDNYRPFKAR